MSSLRTRIRREVIQFSGIFLVVLLAGIEAVFLGITLLPETIPKDDAFVILQSIIGIDGALIGFSGIVGGLILTRPSIESELTPWRVALYVLLTTIFFILSILYCIGGLAALSDKSPLSRTTLIGSLFSMTVGIGTLFSFVFAGINAASRNVRDAE